MSLVEIPGLSPPQAADLIRLLQSASTIAVLTGAGASAESGIPTFRDAQTGLWSRFKAEDLATPESFLRNPPLVWGWYESRRTQIATALPNQGHFALAQWEHSRNLAIITQNVDDLHERAGSRNVIHLHGSIFAARCFDCGTAYPMPPPNPSLPPDGHLPPPHCPRCNGLIRPGVVWFNENLPADALETAGELCRAADVLVAIGTSALVYPAAALPQLAAQSGAKIIVVNPTPTPLDSGADYVLCGTAGEILPVLVDTVLNPAAN